MACGKLLIHSFAILATLNFIIAEEGSGHTNDLPPNERASTFQFPLFGNLDFLNPFFGGSSNGTGLPSFDFPFHFGSLFGGSRQGDVHHHDGRNNDEENDDDDAETRLFFSSIFGSRLTTCNYTTQAGSTCASCTQVLRCFSNNVGKLKPCKKFFPYCNNGRCSLIPGSACSSATTTAAADTTTVATDSTTVTG